MVELVEHGLVVSGPGFDELTILGDEVGEYGLFGFVSDEGFRGGGAGDGVLDIEIEGVFAGLLGSAVYEAEELDFVAVGLGEIVEGALGFYATGATVFGHDEEDRFFFEEVCEGDFLAIVGRKGEIWGLVFLEFFGALVHFVSDGVTGGFLDIDGIGLDVFEWLVGGGVFHDGQEGGGDNEKGGK